MVILKEQFQLVCSLRTAMTELASNPRAAFVGFKHIFILAVLYELAFALWALGDATVTMPALLKIPEDRYYYYELTFASCLLLPRDCKHDLGARLISYKPCQSSIATNSEGNASNRTELGSAPAEISRLKESGEI